MGKALKARKRNIVLHWVLNGLAEISLMNC
jgi:hypothetical protein